MSGLIQNDYYFPSSTVKEEHHWKTIHDPSQRYFVGDSLAQWLALGIFLTSFAILINNTTNFAGGEPKVATYMIVLSILIVCVMTPIYIVQRWHTCSRLMNGFVILIAILLVVAMVWLLTRIWVKF
jgi:hypothetical protein